MRVSVMLSPDMCSQLETTTVGDQVEAVRREHNHAPKEKCSYRQLEQRVQWIKGRMSAGQVSIWHTTVHHDKRIPRWYWTSNWTLVTNKY